MEKSRDWILKTWRKVGIGFSKLGEKLGLDSQNMEKSWDWILKTWRKVGNGFSKHVEK